MSMSIAVFYGKNERNDGEHAFEVLQNEAHHWGVSAETYGKNRLQFGDVLFHFIEVGGKEVWRKPKVSFQKAYVSQTVRKEYELEIKEKTKNLQFISNPTQALVDYVKEIDHLVREKEKGESKLKGVLKAELITEAVETVAKKGKGKRKVSEKRTKQLAATF